jgi:membrane protease YdiL (CAAX protease family)
MSLPTDQQPPNPPWGPISTVAWGLAALFMSFVALVVVVLGLRWSGVWREPVSSSDGKVIAFVLLASVPAELAVLIFAARLRRWPPAIYLGLVWPRRAEVIVAAVAVIVTTLTFFAINTVLIGTGHGDAFFSSSQSEQWRSAADTGWLFWLLVAVVVAAPIGEEVMFRGFLFRGLARPGWEVHAIGATALAWALLHTQYSYFVVGEIFLDGLMLGWFRWASGSTALTIGMHMFMNALAMFTTWIWVEAFS